jgi:hypothetical protein
LWVHDADASDIANARPANDSNSFSLIRFIFKGLFFQFFHDQLGKFARVVNTLSIHKHRRRSANTDFRPFSISCWIKRWLDADWRSAIELVHIQPHLPGDLQNFRIVDLLVILEQPAVELPEFTLIARSQGRHGALMGKFMVRKREVLDRIANVIGEFFQHLLDIPL